MLCGALKEANRLRGTVVILVVLCSAGVSGAGRMLIVVVAMINR
jgi:hypothetical protein